MILCDSIKPGKQNATIFGCVRQFGHKGLHINGRSQLWKRSKEERKEPCDSNGDPMPICKGCAAEWPNPHAQDCSEAQS